jgi:hypothetical protein
MLAIDEEGVLPLCVDVSLLVALVIRSRPACMDSNTVPLKMCFLGFEAALLPGT